MIKFNELKDLFDSKTIKPSFELVHIVLSILLYGDHPEGLGRYRLESELLIGSGTAKSLVKRLKKVGEYIQIPEYRSGENQEVRRKGHVLTEKGLQLLTRIKKTIPIITQTDADFLKEIVIDSKDKSSYLCLIKKAIQNLGKGITQRDAAMMIGGLGATCLVYDGAEIVFPEDFTVDNIEMKVKIKKKLQTYFKTKILNENVNLEKGDVIVIGIADDTKKARLAALNAALTLL